MKTKFSLSPDQDSLFLLMLMRMRPAATQPRLFSRELGEVQEISSASIIVSHVTVRDDIKIKMISYLLQLCISIGYSISKVFFHIM